MMTPQEYDECAKEAEAIAASYMLVFRQSKEAWPKGVVNLWIFRTTLQHNNGPFSEWVGTVCVSDDTPELAIFKVRNCCVSLWKCVAEKMIDGMAHVYGPNRQRRGPEPVFVESTANAAL